MIQTIVKLEIYKSILAHLTYWQTVWYFCCSSAARKVEHVQEQGLCATYCSKSVVCKELLHIAKLPTLGNRQLQEITIIISN